MITPASTPELPTEVTQEQGQLLENLELYEQLKELDQRKELTHKEEEEAYLTLTRSMNKPDQDADEIETALRNYQQAVKNNLPEEQKVPNYDEPTEEEQAYIKNKPLYNASRHIKFHRDSGGNLWEQFQSKKYGTLNSRRIGKKRDQKTKYRNFVKKFDQQHEIHKALSWTACTQDNCWIHLADKQGAQYYPHKTKKQKHGIWDDRNRYHQHTSYRECTDLYCLTHKEKKERCLGWVEPKDFDQELEKREEAVQQKQNPNAYNDEYMEVLDSDASEESGGVVTKFIRKDSEEARKYLKKDTDYLPVTGTQRYETLPHTWYVHRDSKEGQDAVASPPADLPTQEELEAEEGEEDQYAAATLYGKHFTRKILIHGKTATVMIDSGASANFITKSFAVQANIPLVDKDKAIRLWTVDRREIKQEGTPLQTTSIEVNFEHHTEKLAFDLLDSSYDAILGMPWLLRHNPMIDWMKKDGTNDISFNCCECSWDPWGQPNLTVSQNRNRRTKKEWEKRLAESTMTPPIVEEIETDTIETDASDYALQVVLQKTNEPKN
jgi:hypothetical protein